MGDGVGSFPERLMDLVIFLVLVAEPMGLKRNILVLEVFVT